ncbi:MAG: hypothetical protein SGILL_008373, partial [Bacillariaceae sp.]
MGLCPLVHQDQLAAFESFAYDYYYEKRQPPFDNETAAVKPFGRGVWGKDAEGSIYHVTNGTTFYPSPHQDLIAPILHHNAGPHPALMLNLRFEQARGQAIDDVIACSTDRRMQLLENPLSDNDDDIECGTISDMLILTSQEVEPGPGALIFSPIYPDQDPNELVGVLASSIVWDEVLQNLFTDAVSGIDCVLSTDTQIYTYHIEEGIASLAQEGDLHLEEYDEYTSCILLSHASGLYNLENSANYTLTLTPTDAFFETYQTQIPLIAAIAAAVCILITSICFICYDAFVRRDMNIKTELLEAKRKFVRFVSHEVRTPLNSVCMGLSLIQEELLDCIKNMKDEDGGIASSNKSQAKCNCSVDKSKAQGWLQLSEEILISAQSSVTVLNDLLNYDKIQMGQLSLEYTVIPIYRLISITSKEFSLPAASKKIRFELINDGLHDVDECSVVSTASKEFNIKEMNVVGDTIRLTQVLRNLLSNALKFTKEGGTLKVHVHSRKTLPTMRSFVMTDGNKATYESRGILLVDVTDDGVGMSPEQLSKLFTAGTQFNVNELQAGQGSGLGLYIARGIMEQHDGNLVASSEGLGHGTTFTMSLPLYKVPEAESSSEMMVADATVKPSSSVPSVIDGNSSDIESDTASTADLEISADSPRRKSRRILVVDDAKMNRKLLKRLLENHGHACDEAENGLEAVDKVKDSLQVAPRQLFDTILLDFQMPVMSGPDACRLIREELEFSGMIIGITGNVMPEDVALFKSRGAN